MHLVAFEQDTLISAEPIEGSGVHLTVKAILEPGGTHAEWLHFGARATRRKP